MVIGELDISIVDYLGKMEDGIVVLLSIKYLDNIYDATYWYNNEYKIITTSEEFDKEFGKKINDYEFYNNVIESLDNNTSDFEEAFDKMKDLNN